MPSLFENPHADEYFRRLNAPLKSLPAPERAEVHQELRQHLDALVSAHMELGATEDEAVRAALRSFGDPVKIGRQMAGEWKHKSGSRLLSNVGSLLGGCASFLVAEKLCTFLTPAHYGEKTLWDDLVSYGLVPIVAGCLVGLLIPRHAVKSLRAVSLFLVVTFPVNIPLALRWPNPVDGVLQLIIYGGFGLAFCTALLGGGAAYLISALRNGRLHRLTWQSLR